jgi:threonine/homoserine/homoserine lactone efflux protein
MVQTDIIVALAGFCLVSSITPGPNNLMLLNSGARFGFVRTVPHLLGVAIGFTVMVVLVGAGFAGVFEAVPQLHQVLRIVSVAYVLFLAWKIATGPCHFEGDPRGPGKPLNFIQAALFQWVNPKAWSMAVTAVTGYAPSHNPVVALTATAAIFGVVNLPCVGLWTVLGTRLRVILSSPARFRFFNVSAALLLVGTVYPLVFQ